MLRSFAILLLFAGAAMAGTPAVQPPVAITAVVFSQQFGDPPAAEYIEEGNHNGKTLAKPYLVQLKSPAGVNVLRDQVPDHPHHHGLMFAVGIDGVDFWSEAEKCGRQIERKNTLIFQRRPLPRLSVSNGNAESPREAEKGLRPDESEKTPPANPSIERSPEGCVEQIDWVGPGEQQVLAQETRTIRVVRDADCGATLLTWKTELRPPGGKPSIKLTGSHYFGLGMRFVQSMDGADDFFTPEGKAAGETVRGNERLVRGKWCAYAAEVDGKPVTVAMFDHPENVRPAWWFIMAKQFAYMSATLNLHREPLVVEAGKPLTLVYGVAVWDGKVKAEAIEKLYARWLELSAPKP